MVDVGICLLFLVYTRNTRPLDVLLLGWLRQRLCRLVGCLGWPRGSSFLVGLEGTFQQRGWCGHTQSLSTLHQLTTHHINSSR